MKKTRWLDAVSKRISKEALESLNKDNSGKELLTINTTYGKVKELKDVIIIITEESTDDDTEVTIIPKDWVIE